MANPNIMQASEITLENEQVDIDNVGVPLLTSAATECKRIKSMYISNLTPTDCTVTLEFINATDSTDARLTDALNIPANSTYSVFEKPVYLDENVTLKGTAQLANSLRALISYEHMIP